MDDSFVNLTPLIGQKTLHPNNEQSSTPELILSDEAKKYVMFRRQRMIAARDARDAPHQEFDDMGFVKWYDVQLKADNQYIKPRNNAVDTSINTGTIRDKDSTLVQYANKYDFEPVAQCFGEDDEMMDELAETAEDMVRKSFILEDWRTKAKLIYRSMVTFGTAMVEDAWIEHWTTEKDFGTGKIKIGDPSLTWTEKRVKQYDGCQSKLWDLRKCYFGDIRKFFMNGPTGQPYFFTVEYESYDTTKEKFGDFERFKYVPTSVVLTPEISANTTYSSYWTLRPISMNYCEIVRYYDPIANEYALMINGVDMLPILERKGKDNEGQPKTFISGFPLTAISPSGLIPFAKYDLEPMHDFAYSKSQTQKMRVLGDIENMFFKLMLGMMKQKAKPTMGNKSGKNFDQSVTEPGEIVNDVRDGDLFPILPNYTGATASDFSFYTMIKKEMSKNSVQDSFQGIDNQGSEMTATQDLNNMKSGSLDVAALFDGIIYGNQQLYWLRTYNIAKNWTKPIDQQIDVFTKTVVDKFRTVTIPTSSETGGSAVKKIIFTRSTPKGKPTLSDSQDLHQQELDHKKNGGGDISIVLLHPEQFASMKYNWYYSCIPVLTETDPLSYMIFAKQIGDAIATFGIESMNVKKLKRKFAKSTGTDFDTWFLSEQEIQQKQQEMMQGQDMGGGNSPIVPTTMAHGAMPGANPSVANIARGARPQIGTMMR
jgi:hypothetical protein